MLLRTRTALLVALAACMVGVIAPPQADVVSAEGPASAFAPVVPCRLLDTRRAGGARVAPGSVTTVQVSNTCGVAPGSVAAAVTITATDARSGGYVTLFASGSPRPDTSVINYRTGGTVANSAVIALSAGGSIEVFSSAEVHLVVDVSGSFVPAPSAVSAGRFQPTPPTRLLDTRSIGARGAGDLLVPLPAGVPADALGLVVSIAIVEASGPAYLTIHPAGSPRPEASVVNADALERTRAVTVFAPVTAGGLIVHRSADSDVLVDIAGWFTGPSAAPSTDGLFVPQDSQRVWDSRRTADPIHPGGTVERVLVGATATAAVVNVTVTDATRPGYLTAFPAGTPRPTASVLNVTWRDPLAALTVVPVSTRGAAFFASSGVQVLLDVAGWFTGVPAGAPEPVPPNTAPVVGGNVLFVSDSSLGGIRWNGARGSLQGANFVDRLESCRRVVDASCRGREGYAPPTAVETILGTPGQFDTLVIGVGYNDGDAAFERGLGSAIAAARSRGIATVVWINFRERIDYVSPQGRSNSSTFVSHNAALVQRVVAGASPELVIANWNVYTAARPYWLTADGVHVTGDGPRAAAEYVSRKLAFLDRRPCPAGIGGPTAAGGWCADPDTTGPP